MNLFEFMSEHPVLTVILALIAGNVLIQIAVVVAS
jgi:hypothetical protein